MKSCPASMHTDRARILSSLAPELTAERWMFCQSPEMPGALACAPLMTFREAEGLTLILPEAEAARLGLRSAGPYRRIILSAQTSLEAVGITAAVSAALAHAGISCNIVAAFHHDHIFVRDADAERALETLSGGRGSNQGECAST